MTRLTCTIAALGLLAIAIALAAQEPSAVEIKMGEAPEKLVLTNKEVGDVLYSKFDFAVMQGIRLDHAFAAKLLARKLTVDRDTFLWTYEGKQQLGYCVGREEVQGLWDQDSGLCFRDSNDDGFLDSLHIPGTAFGNWSPIKQPAPYHKDSVIKTGRGFRYELLYEGIAAGVLRLAYREYINDFARPAFTQELTYTLEPGSPTEIVFRGARLRVRSANNEGISYEVISGLRDQ